MLPARKHACIVTRMKKTGVEDPPPSWDSCLRGGENWKGSRTGAHRRLHTKLGKWNCPQGHGNSLEDPWERRAGADSWFQELTVAVARGQTGTGPEGPRGLVHHDPGRQWQRPGLSPTGRRQRGLDALREEIIREFIKVHVKLEMMWGQPGGGVEWRADSGLRSEVWVGGGRVVGRETMGVDGGPEELHMQGGEAPHSKTGAAEKGGKLDKGGASRRPEDSGSQARPRAGAAGPAGTAYGARGLGRVLRRWNRPERWCDGQETRPGAPSLTPAWHRAPPPALS